MSGVPGVEVTANALRHAKLEAPIVKVDGQDSCRVFDACTPTTPAGCLRGRAIHTIGRRGKFVLLGLDHGAVLALHRGKSGKLAVRPGSTPADRYVRFTLTFGDGRARDFNDPRLFERIACFASTLVAERFLDEQFGRDAPLPLDSAWFRTRFGTRRPAIKLLLPDQRLLAGIGIPYADDTL
jgi:formamidopyrimidine-DNA glycosylase